MVSPTRGLFLCSLILSPNWVLFLSSLMLSPNRVMFLCFLMLTWDLPGFCSLFLDAESHHDYVPLFLDAEPETYLGSVPCSLMLCPTMIMFLCFLCWDLPGFCSLFLDSESYQDSVPCSWILSHTWVLLREYPLYISPTWARFRCSFMLKKVLLAQACLT